MTIKDFVGTVRYYATLNKLTNYFSEGDVYEIMNEGEKTYPGVILTINNIQYIEKETKINCYLFYIDRLIEDDSNRLDIWAEGADILQKIIYRVGYNNFDIIMGENVVYMPFKEKFQDLCAGVYAQLDFSIINNVNNCTTEIDGY